jgi:ribosomal-protein-alanine N-acetyltransferase
MSNPSYDRTNLEKTKRVDDLGLKGERIYLRPLRPTDIDDRYTSWHTDPALLRYYTSSKRDFSKNGLLGDLQSAAASKTHFLAICTNESELCIGNVKIGPVSETQLTSDLVAFIGDRSYHGKGLAVEAIKLANRVAFEQLGLRKLTGGMHDENKASIHAYVKAGWVLEGRLKAHYWIDGKGMDRVLASCFNPAFFSEAEIEQLRLRTSDYL